MKIDMHIHTTERSTCAHSSEKEQIASAIAHGLDAIVIADHNRLVPMRHIEELNRIYAPFRIFPGIEVSTYAGNQEDHFLVLGITDTALEERRWTYEQLHPFVVKRGGYLALCHPYRNAGGFAADIKQYKPDAIEVHSINVPPADEARIQTLADSLKIHLIANSDSHDCRNIGVYYNQLSEAAADVAALIRLLKSGAYRLGCDKPRLEWFDREVRNKEWLL